MKATLKVYTKSEAEEEVSKRINEQRALFCPLARAKCTSFCLCFVNPKVKEHGAQMFRVSLCYCDNPMFTGERTVNNNY